MEKIYHKEGETTVERIKRKNTTTATATATTILRKPEALTTAQRARIPRLRTAKTNINSGTNRARTCVTLTRPRLANHCLGSLREASTSPPPPHHNIHHPRHPLLGLARFHCPTLVTFRTAVKHIFPVHPTNSRLQRDGSLKKLDAQPALRTVCLLVLYSKPSAA